MKKSDVLDHFGGPTATAKALGLSQPTVTNWGDVVPPLRQLQVESLTGGVLKADPGCFHIKPKRKVVTAKRQAKRGAVKSRAVAA